MMHLTSVSTVVVGLLLLRVRIPCGQSGILRGLELVPLKWCYLIPPTAATANR